MNNDTTITYERVEADANNIRDYANNMKRIFDDFSATMNNIFSSGSFQGQASEQFKSEYDQLRSKFDSYTTLVEKFASKISSANQAINQTEQSIMRDTEIL